MTTSIRSLSRIERADVDRLLAWGVDNALSVKAIADEAGLNYMTASRRLRALGYLSLLCSPEEQALIRSYRNAKKQGGKAA